MPNQLTTEEQKLELGRTAQRLAIGYYGFAVAQFVAANPDSDNSLPPAALGQNPIGEIKRKDGTSHRLDMRRYLDSFREDMDQRNQAMRAWATGALITLGDELARYHYVDRAPVLELIRHLRNGAAHGNRFNISDGTKLSRFPAHNKEAAVRSPTGTVFEITPRLNGSPLLFEFLAGGDLIDLLLSVDAHFTGIVRAWS